MIDNNKQQHLNLKNVSYRNEGDYHCEARNQINGVSYGVRSSNIILDVYGEPQFLVKVSSTLQLSHTLNNLSQQQQLTDWLTDHNLMQSPSYAKAVQATKSDLSLTFCSDPAPNKVYWQFGSLRLDVR